MADPNTQQQAQPAAAAAEEANPFVALIEGDLKLKNDDQRSAVRVAVRTLAEQALANTAIVGDDAIASIKAMIAELDRKLSEQVNLIIHNEEFKSLEGTWRGLHHLVSNTETDTMMRIRVLNCPKKDAAKSLRKFKGTAWDQSPLFKKIYGAEFDTPGGTPYGCVIGDYQFDHSAPDVEMLAGMAQIGAASHCPFITAASPSLYRMESWQELNNPVDLEKIQAGPEHAAWRSLRESEDARYLGLTMPRVLARMPYGAKTNPVEEFAFEEDAEGGDHSKYTWMNSAYAMGVNINRSHKEYGWGARIRGTESGGIVEGLPVHTFPTDDGGVDMKCPTEIAIGDRREAELSTKLGMMPISHYKNTDYAVFISAQSLQKPQQYDNSPEGKEATANANLSARFPYLFSTCRFAHYLKCLVRDKIGSFKEREDMELFLNKWITNYVTADPLADEKTKARYPLREARVEVFEVEGNPGYYTSKFYLRPHFQLEGLTVSLSLVAKLPAPKK